MHTIIIDYQTKLSGKDAQLFFEFLSHQLVIQKQLSIETQTTLTPPCAAASTPLLYGAFFQKNTTFVAHEDALSDDLSNSESSETSFQFKNNTLCQPIDCDTYQVHIIHPQSFPDGGFATVNSLIGSMAASKMQFIQDLRYPGRVVKCQPFSKGSLESEYEFAKNISYLHFQKPIITPGQYFGIMHRCPGEELFILIADEVKLRLLPFQFRVDLTRELLSRLNEIHEAGIVHGDIKPENIIVNFQAHPIRIYYIDFGMAFSLTLGSEQTVQSEIARTTLAYASIEVLKGRTIQPDKRDVFGLGRILQLLWGYQVDDSYSDRAVAVQIDYLQTLPVILSKPEALFKHIDDIPSNLIEPIRQWLISMLHPDVTSRVSIQQAAIHFNQITEHYLEAESWSHWIWSQTPTPIQSAYSWLVQLISTEQNTRDPQTSIEESISPADARPESFKLGQGPCEEQSDDDDVSSSPFALLGPPTDSPDTITIWAEQSAYAFRGFRRISQTAVNQDEVEPKLLARP